MVNVIIVVYIDNIVDFVEKIADFVKNTVYFADIRLPFRIHCFNRFVLFLVLLLVLLLPILDLLSRLQLLLLFPRPDIRGGGVSGRGDNGGGDGDEL